MNKNQLKGRSKELTGKIRETTGKVVGSEKMERQDKTKRIAARRASAGLAVANSSERNAP